MAEAGYGDAFWGEPLDGGPWSAFHYAMSISVDGELPQIVSSPRDGNTEGRLLPADGARPDQKALVGSPPEVAVAAADFRCRQQTDYLNRYVAIVVDLENQYIAAHREELDQLLATWEQQQDSS
jgi:hypothetical protein